MADAPPFDPSQPFEPVSVGVPPFDPSKPFETVGADAAAPRPDSGQRTLVGGKTAQDLGVAPQRPAGYVDTWQQFHDEAEARIKKGYDEVMEASKPGQGVGGTLTAPFRQLGGHYDMAAGAVQRTIAPATAAFRNYVSVPVEGATGLPAEKLEDALQMGVPGRKGAPALGPFEHPTPPTRSLEDLATATHPEGGNPLSLPGTLAKSPVVDMGEFERSLAQPDAPTAEAAPETAATPPDDHPIAPAATPRDNLDVSLLPPEAPHAVPEGGYRRSVGAAGAQSDPLAGYSEPTIERAREIMTANGLDNPHMLEQAFDEQSQHHIAGELTPGLERELGGIRAADRGEAANTITQTLKQRANEAPERMGGAFDRAFGETQNRAELQRSIEAERTKTATPFWKTFTQTEVPPTPQLRALMPRLEAAGALKAANKAMREEGLPAQRGFLNQAVDEHGEMVNEIEHVPTAAAFQYAKEHLDTLIDKSLAEPGGAKAARRYTQLKNDLVRAIDNHPDPDVAGVWQAARRAWQQPTELLESQNLGRRLLTQHIDREDVPFLTAGWSPERMEHLKIGLRDYLEGLAKSNRNPNRTSNKLMDAVLSPGNQEKIRAVLGDDKADDLIKSIEHEESMHGTPNRVLYGSPTAERQTARDRYLPQPSGLQNVTVGSVAHAAHSPIKAGLRYAAEKAATAIGKKVSAKQEAEFSKLREELARLFTTQGEEKKAVLRALIGSEEPPVPAWSRPSAAPTPGAAANLEHSPPIQPARAPVRGAEPEYEPHPNDVEGIESETRTLPPEPTTPQPLPKEATDFVAEALKNRKRSPPKNPDLLHFLSERGGLSASDPLASDVLSIFGKNPYVPGYGSLLRKSGRRFDEAREASVGAGYLARGEGPRHDNTTIKDLLDALNDHARGRKRYAAGAEREAGFDPDENQHRVESDVLHHFEREGVPVPTGKLRDRVVELVHKEHLTPLEAHERAVMESHYAGSDEGIPRVSKAKTTGKLPADANTASASRAPAGQGQGQSARPGVGEASRVSGQGHPGSHERTGQPDHQAEARASAVRLARGLGVTEQVQHLAMQGKSAKEISDALERKLAPDEVEAVREHLGIAPAHGGLLAPGEKEHDFDIPFARGGAVPSLKTRVDSRYSPTRGKPDHHCGPDQKWPHGFCRHYRQHNRCVLVRGFIAAKGGCEWYSKAKEG